MAKKRAASESIDFTPHAEDPFLSYTEAGALVGRSNTTIGRWVEDGLLKCVRDPSGCPRIRKSELTRFYGATALAEVDEERRARDEESRRAMLERMRENSEREEARANQESKQYMERFLPHLANQPVEATLVEEENNG